jgi:hypothetical protein
MTKYQSARHRPLDNDLSVTFTVWASDYDSALEQAVTILTTKYYPTITRAQILGDHLGASSAGSLGRLKKSQADTVLKKI